MSTGIVFLRAVASPNRLRKNARRMLAASFRRITQVPREIQRGASLIHGQDHFVVRYGMGSAIAVARRHSPAGWSGRGEKATITKKPGEPDGLPWRQFVMS
jgi:hypothetical protein